MQSAGILRHSKAERRRTDRPTSGTMIEGRTVPRKGIKEKASKRRDHERTAAEKPARTRVLAFPAKVGGMLRRPPSKGPKRSWRKHRTESLAGSERLMEEVCEAGKLKQALQRSRPIKGVRGSGMT